LLLLPPPLLPLPPPLLPPSLSRSLTSPAPMKAGRIPIFASTLLFHALDFSCLSLFILQHCELVGV
jgi:hypothetical protein